MNVGPGCAVGFCYSAAGRSRRGSVGRVALCRGKRCTAVFVASPNKMGRGCGADVSVSRLIVWWCLYGRGRGLVLSDLAGAFPRRVLVTLGQVRALLFSEGGENCLWWGRPPRL